MKIAGIHITIEKYETLGGSPASCRIIVPGKQATIKIAKEFFRDFDKPTKMFVILHELGHAVLNSGDEIEVDRWAFKQYAKTGLPLKGAVFALSRVINPLQNSEHAQRVKLQFYRAKHAQFRKGKLSFKKFKTLTH